MNSATAESAHASEGREAPGKRPSGPQPASHPRRKKNFLQQHLDPASRLGEVLFGLIMVLTVTLTASLTAKSGAAGVRQLLVAAVGCNIAWGIIDGVMYIMNCMTVRSGKARLVRAVQKAPDRASALETIRLMVEPGFQYLTKPRDKEAVYEAILEEVVHAHPPRTKVILEDLHGAVACFLLVVLSCLPAAVPFLIFSNPTLALRVSNVLLIGMLFWVGQKWAYYIHGNRLLTGVVMVAVGLALVGLAALLGG
ncbi:MAG: VIT family protein [Verrucomicrobia bacterium]|nr:MAG: VIT family protein [Verrucomicrobiota bacterium]